MRQSRHEKRILGAIGETDSEIVDLQEGIKAFQFRLSEAESRKKMLEELLSEDGDEPQGNEENQSEYIHGLGRVLREGDDGK